MRRYCNLRVKRMFATREAWAEIGTKGVGIETGNAVVSNERQSGILGPVP
jgi:hypothetical protein